MILSFLNVLACLFCPLLQDRRGFTILRFLLVGKKGHGFLREPSLFGFLSKLLELIGQHDQVTSLSSSQRDASGSWGPINFVSLRSWEDQLFLTYFHN